MPGPEENAGGRDGRIFKGAAQWENPFVGERARGARDAAAPTPPRVTASPEVPRPWVLGFPGWFRKSAARLAESAGQARRPVRQPGRRVGAGPEGSALFRAGEARIRVPRAPRGLTPAERARWDRRNLSARVPAPPRPAGGGGSERESPAGSLGAGGTETQRQAGCGSIWGAGKGKAKAARPASDRVKAPRSSPDAGSTKSCLAEPGAPQPWPSPTWPRSMCSRISC